MSKQSFAELGMCGVLSGCTDTLAATDVTLRGIDVDGISHVINFDPPADHHAYIHRVGQTARARNRGVGVTLIGAGRPPAGSR